MRIKNKTGTKSSLDIYIIYNSDLKVLQCEMSRREIACSILFIFIVNKKVVWGATEDCTHGIQRFITDGLSFIIYHFVEILIAHTELLVEPVLGFFMFL